MKRRRLPRVENEIRNWWRTEGHDEKAFMGRGGQPNEIEEQVTEKSFETKERRIWTISPASAMEAKHMLQAMNKNESWSIVMDQNV